MNVTLHPHMQRGMDRLREDYATLGERECANLLGQSETYLMASPAHDNSPHSPLQPRILGSPPIDTHHPSVAAYDLTERLLEDTLRLTYQRPDVGWFSREIRHA